MPQPFKFDTNVDTRALERLIADFPDDLENVVDVTGRSVEKRMKLIAEEKKIFKTGTLISSIESRKEDPSNRFERVIGPSVEYAIWQEIGTRSFPARPFVTPAAEEERKPFTDAIVSLIEKKRI